MFKPDKHDMCEARGCTEKAVAFNDDGEAYALPVAPQNPQM